MKIERDSERDGGRKAGAASSAPPRFRLSPSDPPKPLDEMEREHIQAAIVWAQGNKTLAARALGIDRRTLFRKLAKYRGKV